MLRRLLGACLGILLIGAAISSGYPDTAKKEISSSLRFEISYISLDPVEDAGDTSYPYRTSNWSPREKIVPKLTLGPFVRTVRFVPPTIFSCEQLGCSTVIHQDRFQYHEVWRI